jgi:6-phosphogluconolactonase (cycloisomerase 2 family)
MPLSCAGIASTGAQPLQIVIAPSGSFLYTVDTGSLNGTGYSITAFSIDAGTGCLTALQTLPITDGPPYAATIDRTGHFLFVPVGGVPVLLSPGINVYSISPGGMLIFQSTFIAPYSGFARTFFSSVAADPVADLLFAVEGRSGTGQVEVLTIDSITGKLAHVATSLTGGDLAEDIVIDSLGTVVFIANGFGGVGVYSVASAGALTAFTGSPFGPTNPGLAALAIDPSGKFLYGTNSVNSSSFLMTFSIGSGSLTQQGTISLDAGATSIAVARRQ